MDGMGYRLVCIDVTDGMVVSSISGAAVLFRVICIGESILSINDKLS